MRLSIGSMAALGVACFAALAMWPENQALQGPARVAAETKAQQDKEEVPIEAEVAHPISRDVADYVVCVGTIMPSKKVEIRAQTTGYLKQPKFPTGGWVNTGDVLFEIDAQRQMAEVERAQAEVARAAAHAKRMEVQLEGTRALAEKAVVHLSEVALRETDLSEARAELDAAKIDAKIAQVEFGYTRLVAPISGQLSRPLIDQGNLVKANETRLAELASTDPICAGFHLDTSAFLRLRRAVNGEFRESEIPVTVLLAGEEACAGRWNR